MADADESHDIDLGWVWRALSRNWWLILVLLALGVLAAVGVSLASGKSYQAQSAVYLGQPTDANGNPINGINSNPKGAAQIVMSGDVLRQAASEVGDVSAARLRDQITVEAPTVTVKSLSAPTNFVTITVTDTRPAVAIKAANSLAAILVNRVSSYARTKIALLSRQILGDRQRLSGLQDRIVRAQDALDAIAAGGGSAAERATASVAYAAIIQSASTLRDSLIQRLQATELARTVARQVELPSVFSTASPPAKQVTAGLTTAALAGLVAGLVVGVALALFRERSRPARA